MSRPTPPAIPLIELVLAAVSAATIALLLGYLGLQEWRSRSPRPPEITVRLGSAQPLSSGWLVPFAAGNVGDLPVSQLTVELTAGEERAETVIDFLAARSTAKGGFFLSGDPGTAPLHARALGFVEP
ncbi:MAG: hypothetical protein AB7I59_19395 [Geminicoccaceae bacterium]